MEQRLGHIKDLLDIKAEYYNNIKFIADDPVSIPHLFDRKEDIEISAFLAAILAWGQRKTIIRKASELLGIMNFSPYEFVTRAGPDDFRLLERFQHRTFNSIDCIYFIQSLQHIYLNLGGLEEVFTAKSDQGIKAAIMSFRTNFFTLPYSQRTVKHIADPARGSSAKRINMFLRWMVRHDAQGVDFGLWKNIRPSQLYCPLDIHTGNVARKLRLITRKQNDWKALEELMVHLRSFDPHDPVKYDFALFGLGIYENF